MTSKPVKVFQDEKGRLYIKNKKGKKTFIKTSLTKDAVQKNFIKEWKKSKIKKTRTKRSKKLYRTKPVTKKEIDSSARSLDRSADTKSSSGIPVATDEQAKQVAESKKPQGRKDTLYLTVGEKDDLAIQEAKKVQDITSKILEIKNVKALLHDTSRNDTTSKIIADDKLAQLIDIGNELNERVQSLEDMSINIGKRTIKRQTFNPVKITELSPEIPQAPDIPEATTDVKQVAEAKPQTIYIPSKYLLDNKREYADFRYWYKKWYRENKEKNANLKSYSRLDSTEIREQYVIYLKNKEQNKLEKDKNVTINLELIKSNEEQLKKIQDLEDQLNKRTPVILSNTPIQMLDIAEGKSKQNLSDTEIKTILDIPPSGSKSSKSERLILSDTEIKNILDIPPSGSKSSKPKPILSDIFTQVENIEPEPKKVKRLSDTEIKTILDIPSATIAQPKDQKLSVRNRNEVGNVGVTIQIPSFANTEVKTEKAHNKTLEQRYKDVNTLYENNTDFQNYVTKSGYDWNSIRPNLKLGLQKQWKDVLNSAPAPAPAPAKPVAKPVAKPSALSKPEVKPVKPESKTTTVDDFYNSNFAFRYYVTDEASGIWEDFNNTVKNTLKRQWDGLNTEQKNEYEMIGEGHLSDIYPDESLYESEIQKLFKEENYQFLPVIAHNEIHKIKLNKRKPTFFVMNLSDRGDIGTHWTSTYINEKGNIYYFDSFGKPPDEETKDQLRDLFEQHGEGTNMLRRLKYNTKGIQDPLASDCGFWAIQFVENMLDGKSFSNSINITEEDLKDEKIHKKEWM